MAAAARLRAGQAARLPACAAAAAAARAVVVNGAPGAIASSAIDLGAAAAVRCSARRPPDRSKAAESRPYGLCADRPYRAPRSALPGITRTTSLQGGCRHKESSDCRHKEQGKPRECVSPELTSSGEPSSFVAAARASLPARCGHAHSGYCHTYVTANNIQILGMNLIYFAGGKILLSSSPAVSILSPMRISE